MERNKSNTIRGEEGAKESKKKLASSRSKSQSKTFLIKRKKRHWAEAVQANLLFDQQRTIHTAKRMELNAKVRMRTR